MVRTEFRDDAGQVVPVAVALMALLVVALLALVPAAAALGQRARAGTAADAAALAGAAGGEGEARRLAESTGGEVVDFDRVGDEVVVRVRVGEVEAEARAQGRRRPPTGTGGGSGGERAGLSPGLGWCRESRPRSRGRVHGQPRPGPWRAGSPCDEARAPG